MHTRDPREQIESGNAWYTDDQFEKQYDRPGPREVIENRWRLFERAIADYIAGSGRDIKADPLRILDAGCGDGINLSGLSEICRARGWNVRIQGADYNALRVGRASKLPLIEEVVEASLEALPYVEDHFDIVLCNQVLEHVARDKKVLTELWRTLRSGGRLIVGVPNEGCVMGWMRNHALQRSILKSTDHVNFYTWASLSKLLYSSGFEVHELVRTGFFMPHSAIHYGISHFSLGRRLLKKMGGLWPSQCAELIVVAVKK